MILSTCLLRNATALLWTGFLLLLSLAGRAQSTNASFLGVVTDAKNEPLPGATVQIRNESTGFRTGTATLADGRYQLRQLPLGGPYTVTVTMVGYATQQKAGFMLNQGDQITVRFQLAEAMTDLQEVSVKANRIIDQVQRFGASTAVTAAQIKNLPLENRNFNNLVNLSPLQGNGALGGARSGSTNITIDGGNARSPLWAGATGVTGSMPYAMSQEAIREFEVATNEYTVTQGRQAGGAVNAVTKNGTNVWSGSAFTFAQNDQLQSRNDIRGNRRTADFDRYQWGFSLGGPIIKDKLHFFTAFDRQDERRPAFITDIQNATDEQRFGIRRDTLLKAIDIARRVYGVSQNPQVGQFSNKTTANTLFARFDWTISDKHKLTFRNNFTSWNNPINSGDNSDIVLRETFNKQTARSYTGLASLRSTFSPNFTNEFKLQYQYEYTAQETSDELPGENIPRAIVTVTSPFATSSNPNATTQRTFQFGGQRFTPEWTKYHQFHVMNTSYLTKGKVDFTFGTDTYVTLLKDLFTSELNGRFFFNSLADLEAQRPSRYVREVFLGQGQPIVQYNVIDWAFFGQMETNLMPNLNLMAGLRWDGTAFLTAPAYNQLADQKLGIRTDRKPVDWNNLQPRFQLTWNVGGQNTDIVKIGGGAFTAMAMYYNLANNMLFDGQKIASIDVSGTSVPRPDFISYRRDPSTAPGVPAGSSSVSTINATGPNFQIPMTWKFNISYNKILWNDRLRLGVNFLMSRTHNNYVYLERNLVDEPYFRLGNEAGRGVFVPADRIAANGRSNWLDSRAVPELGRVLELNSLGYAQQWAVIADATLKIGQDGYFNLSYTRNDTKDNSTYNCCVANTSTFLPVVDDPRRLNFGYSETQFRHKLVANGATPSWKGFSLGATVTGVGGTPFSIHSFNAGFGINGDFNDRNDLAFLFDPNSAETDPALANALKAWLANPDVAQPLKDYYLANVGQVAPRNAGVNPFAATIDLRLIKRFRTFRGQSLELTADLFNVANLLNDGNGLGGGKVWGRNRNLGAEQRLLAISGFNRATQRYSYRVNSNTGVNPVGGTPWRLQLGLRYAF